MIAKIWKSLFFTNRFFGIVLGCICFFIISFVVPALYIPAVVTFLGFMFLVFFEIFQLYRNNEGIVGRRMVPKRLSNGDENIIKLYVKNNYTFDSQLKIIDEIPFQFQRRDIQWEKKVAKQQELAFQYTLRPVKRGEYSFGALNVLASGGLGLVERRFSFDQDALVPVYPSYLQMAKYELAAFTHDLSDLGIKKIRRRGQSREFESIKEYVIGDDPRAINWKATAKTRSLKVNEYIEEKSQAIYSLIDKGRLMRMPFNELTLLDYAINSSLILSNIAIKKDDKAGLITYSKKLSSFLKADKKSSQMVRIQQFLYSQKTRYEESNLELVSTFITKKVNQRSLLFLYTNFESYNSFKRQLPYFKIIARQHLLVVIFFRNNELKSVIQDNPQKTSAIYTQVIAEKTEHEKTLIMKKLKSYGIYSILTTPEDLNINTINKYLEIKARGLL